MDDQIGYGQHGPLGRFALTSSDDSKAMGGGGKQTTNRGKINVVQFQWAMPNRGSDATSDSMRLSREPLTCMAKFNQVSESRITPPQITIQLISTIDFHTKNDDLHIQRRTKGPSSGNYAFLPPQADHVISLTIIWWGIR